MKKSTERKINPRRLGDHQEMSERPDGSIRVVTKPSGEPSRVQQQFLEASDINNIMRKYHQTGMVTHLNHNPGRYADLTKIKNYQDSLQTVINAEAAFMTLSSDVRKRFSNSPQEVINFLQNPNNLDEAVKLGLVKPPEPKPSKNDDLNDDKTPAKAPKT